MLVLFTEAISINRNVYDATAAVIPSLASPGDGRDRPGLILTADWLVRALIL